MKIKENEIFIISTDTVIGLASKINEENQNKIYELKRRSFSKRLVIAVGSIEQLQKLESLSEIQKDYINKYWPGATTLIINGNAFRMPKCNKMQFFINEEGPFYLTSANLSNHSTIIDIEEAKKTFPGLRSFDFCKGSNTPSQIIDTKNGERLR